VQGFLDLSLGEYAAAAARRGARGGRRSCGLPGTGDAGHRADAIEALLALAPSTTQEARRRARSAGDAPRQPDVEMLAAQPWLAARRHR
jgi:hypothetical protein